MNYLFYELFHIPILMVSLVSNSKPII